MINLQYITKLLYTKYIIFIIFLFFRRDANIWMILFQLVMYEKNQLMDIWQAIQKQLYWHGN